MLEDELVQLACAKLLTVIYEQDFLALRLPARTVTPSMRYGS